MDIKKTPSGSIFRTSSGYNSFIPHPLPPSITWDSKLANALSQADLLIGKLAGVGSKLPNPHLLMRPFITREAVLSSKIEGTQATISEVLAREAGIDKKQISSDMAEVQNYIAALDYGIERLSTMPLSLRLIREIHEKLMHNVRGEHATPGQFRRTQNWIGTPGCTLNTAKYVPPTPDKLMECLGSFETFLHEETLPPLIHAALCHYQFEAIHPFLDGNGRVGRLLITLLLVKQNILPSPLLYPSAFFEATRDEYYRNLYKVSAEGTWNTWLTYFLHGIALQSADTLARIEAINDLINQWLIMIEPSSSRLPATLIRNLAVNPFIGIQKSAEQFGVAFTTAQRAIKKLEAVGIVEQSSQSTRERVYCASKLLAILEQPTQIQSYTE